MLLRGGICNNNNYITRINTLIKNSAC